MFAWNTGTVSLQQFLLKVYEQELQEGSMPDWVLSLSLNSVVSAQARFLLKQHRLVCNWNYIVYMYCTLIFIIYDLVAVCCCCLVVCFVFFFENKQCLISIKLKTSFSGEDCSEKKGFIKGKHFSGTPRESAEQTLHTSASIRRAQTQKQKTVLWRESCGLEISITLINCKDERILFPLLSFPGSRELLKLCK